MSIYQGNEGLRPVRLDGDVMRSHPPARARSIKHSLHFYFLSDQKALTSYPLKACTKVTPPSPNLRLRTRESGARPPTRQADATRVMGVIVLSHDVAVPSRASRRNCVASESVADVANKLEQGVARRL